MTTPNAREARSTPGDLGRTALWTVVALLVIDFALGFAFRMPSDPRTTPSGPAQYLDFGRSLESKLRRLAGPVDSLAAPVAGAGWLDPATWPADEPVAEGRLRMTVYGQSFSYAIGESLAAAHPEFVFRARGGPAAPAGHLAALWTIDRTRTRSDVAVLGILASSVRGLDATTGATWMFESPYPYTYPRWRLEGDSLAAAWPSIRSLPALRAALADPAALAAWRRELAEHDAWYSPALFGGAAADRSVLVRFLRRAWAQRQQRAHLARVHGPQGFTDSTGTMEVLRRLAVRFARGVRADGGVPVVLLVEDRGYGDHLWRTMHAALEREGVPVLATHALANPDDPANFVGDGHFTGEVNHRLAGALHGLVVRERARAAEVAGSPTAAAP